MTFEESSRMDKIASESSPPLGPPGAGLEYFSTVRTRLGSLSFFKRNLPAVFWISGRGFITPSLIRRELPLVESFGIQHPEGWTYVVDTTRIRLIHPYNVLLLRAVRRLPNNIRYVIVAPAFIRFLARLASPAIRPTHIVSGPDEAIRLLLPAGSDPARDG